MARLKGPVLVSLKKFVLQDFGEKGWSQFLDSFKPQDRIQLDMPISMNWYDLSLIYQCLHALKDTVGNGEEQCIWKFGQFDAEQDLTTIQRVFLRLANPEYVIEKFGLYWNRFCDFGTWQIKRETKKKVRATLLGSPMADRLHCLEMSAYICRLAEMVGAKNINVQHPACRARNDINCTWVVSWT